jgi:hypothetical protein
MSQASSNKLAGSGRNPADRIEALGQQIEEGARLQMAGKPGRFMRFTEQSAV